MPEQKKITFKDLKRKLREAQAEALMRNLNQLGKEGEDHINISIQSETRLGKIFDPAYLKVINYKYIGKFNSVLSLWYWLRSSNLDDNLRRLTGRNLKMYVQSKVELVKFVPNFKCIIGQATWIKVKSYPKILEEIKNFDESKKLVSYHVIKSSGLRVATSYAELIIDITRTIIQAVKEGKEPDFSIFADDKEKIGMLYLEAFLEKVMPPEVLEKMRNSEHSNEEDQVTSEESLEDNLEENPEVDQDSVEVK